MAPGPVDPTLAMPALQALRPVQSAGSAALRTGPAPEGGFAEVAAQVLRNANEAQHEAQRQAEAVAAGEGDMVEALLAMSRADLSLRFVVSLRNKALDAYNEIMRLQL